MEKPLPVSTVITILAEDYSTASERATVAHICKLNKQFLNRINIFLEHNKHFYKHNTVLSKHSKSLWKKSTE